MPIATFFAKTPLSKRWEKMTDQNGDCEHGPHAASLYAEVRDLKPGTVVEVTIHYGLNAARPDGNIALYAVVSDDARGKGVKWVGCRSERS